jgi:acyl-CoA thioester hydrolase
VTRPEPFRLDPKTYPSWVDVATRESDVDNQGHVNSLWLGFFFREAWTRLQARVTDRNDRPTPDRRFLVAHISFDYVREVLHPSIVQVGAGVLKVGRSSLTIGCGLFQQGVAAAVADYTVVFADQDGPVPLCNDERARAAELRLIGGP